MKSSSNLASRLGEVEQPSRLGVRRRRRNRRTRIQRRFAATRSIALTAAKLAVMCHESNPSARFSPSSIVALLLNRRTPDSQQVGSEWIRRAHLSNVDLDDMDRRSPLFTGRMLREDDLVDANDPCGPGLTSQKWPSVNSSRRIGKDISRLNISHRLGPREDRLHLGPSVDSSNLRSQHLEHPTSAWRYRPPSQYDRHSESSYDEYDTDRFQRDHFSPPREERYRESRQLSYPPSKSNPHPVPERKLRSRDPRVEGLGNYFEYPPDDNDGRYGRDAYSPTPQRNRGNWRYYSSGQFSPRRDIRREPRSEVPPIDHQSDYSEYSPNFSKRPYDDERLNTYDSYFPREAYDSDLWRKSSRDVRKSLYFPPGMSRSGHDAATMPQQQRPWIESAADCWRGPPDGNENHSLYNDREDSYLESSDLPQRRSRSFRQSLYYPPGFSSPRRDAAMRPQQQKAWRSTPCGSENQSSYQG